MSKGSNRRKEDTQKIRDNWDKIFGQKKPDKSNEVPKSTENK